MEQSNLKKFASTEQKLRLVHLVEADPQLKSGKFSVSFTKAEAKRRWEVIAEELNSITGARKTWEEWRKTWQDRKANAKKKFSLLRRQANLTGGGPPPDPPTLEESIIINNFDQPSLVGHTDSQESTATIIDLSQPGTSASKTLKLDSSSPGSSNDEVGKNKSNPIINSDLVQQEDLQNIENIPRTVNVQARARLQKQNRRTVAQRRLHEGLNAAQELNKNLEEKNAIKKKFYEEFIKLMTLQTKALTDIAEALSKK